MQVVQEGLSSRTEVASDCEESFVSAAESLAAASEGETSDDENGSGSDQSSDSASETDDDEAQPRQRCNEQRELEQDDQILRESWESWYRKKKEKRTASEKMSHWRLLRSDDFQDTAKASFLLREPQPLPKELRVGRCTASPHRRLLGRTAALRRSRSHQAMRQRSCRLSQSPHRGSLRRNSDGEPPQMWVQPDACRRGRRGSRCSQRRSGCCGSEAEKTLLHDAKMKRAGEMCQVRQLESLAKRSQLRYGNKLEVTAAATRSRSRGEAAHESDMVETDPVVVQDIQVDRRAVTEQAQSFQMFYARVLDGMQHMQEKLSFRKPQRCHTMDYSDMCGAATV